MSRPDTIEDVRRMLERRDFSTAIDSLRRRIEHAPGDTESLYWLANAYRLNGEGPAAETVLTSLLGMDPTHHQAALSLAHHLREQGKLRMAALTIHRSWIARACPWNEALACATFVRQCSEYERAIGICSAALDIRASGPLHELRGELRMGVGEFAAAEHDFRAALELDSTLLSARLRLAHTREYSSRDSGQEAALERLRSGGHAPILSASAGFALAKLYDDSGDFGAAASALMLSNQTICKERQWSSAASALAFKALVEAQTMDCAPADSPRFVYIVGLPRSGTSLFAKELASFSDTASRGELNWIAALYQMAAHDRTAAQTQRHAAANVVRMQMIRDDAPARLYIDKNPLNFRYIGFIANLLPEARFILCTRNLRDTAISLFAQLFAHGDNDYSYSVDDIARFQLQYRDLMAHWARVLPPNRLMNVCYEDLVTTPQTVVARCRQFLGMAADEKDLRHADTRSVDASALFTASAWQARQPVHTRSIGRWQRYGPLANLIEQAIPDVTA